MEETWICPQCDYASAVMAYKNIQLIQRLMHN